MLLTCLAAGTVPVSCLVVGSERSSVMKNRDEVPVSIVGISGSLRTVARTTTGTAAGSNRCSAKILRSCDYAQPNGSGFLSRCLHRPDIASDAAAAYLESASRTDDEQRSTDRGPRRRMGQCSTTFRKGGYCEIKSQSRTSSLRFVCGEATCCHGLLGLRFVAGAFRGFD
jgi:hypothetical protein